MRFHADLHVHSKYSRATSRDLDLEHLAAWAARKGIGVVATGDFTHPAWRAELGEKLVAAEPGLYRLRDDIEKAVMAAVPQPGAFHARGRDLDHLQEGRAHSQNPPSDLCARSRNGRSHVGAARPHRQHRLRRPPDPGPGFARPLGNCARIRPARLSGAGAYLDALVRGARVAIGVRFDRRMLRR